ncbi:MAG: isoprenylcysteine carboxylmethyltransferase family protein [Cyclobacteriaceae bacterium]|nr:isoprenylcysteine carboxylmethyltransferase family protein [Cyclobacteriaceae bacterium]
MIYKFLALVIIVLLNMVRGYYQLKYYRSHSTKVRQVKSVRENVLVWFVTASYVVPGLLWLFTPIIAFEDFELSGYWRWSGFFISMLSMALFYRVHRILGDNWSPVLEIRKDHELIITGPYRWVRHPMYSSIWLGVLGMNLLLCNFVFLTFTLASTIVLCLVRIPDEEQLMVSQFGDAYSNYASGKKRIIPFLI